AVAYLTAQPLGNFPSALYLEQDVVVGSLRPLAKLMSALQMQRQLIVERMDSSVRPVRTAVVVHVTPRIRKFKKTARLGLTPERRIHVAKQDSRGWARTLEASPAS